MTTPLTFLLVPGAGGASWLWHSVAPLLEAAGHRTLAVDLPAADETAGLDAYADIVVRAAHGTSRIVLVASSFGGFTAPLVAARLPIERLVFLNAMIPKPGEIALTWGEDVHSSDARIAAAKAGGYTEEFEFATYFFHDLSPDIAREFTKHDADEAETARRTPCAFDGWPQIPIHVVIGVEDRLFPAAFQERVARERLGAALTSIERVPGGHLAPLSQPEAVAKTLLAISGDAGR